MNATFREIARIMDPDNPPTRLSDLLERHRWLPGTHPTWRQIALRHEHASRIKFLSLNAFLMGSPNSKPEVDDRSNEIGERLRAEGYDVMALCEVWDQSISGWSQAFKLRILHAFGWNEQCGEHDWPNDPLDDRYARGPGPNGIKMDSGLLQVCANPRFKIIAHVPSEGRYFTKLGEPPIPFTSYGDWDYYSEKGILLTRIDVGLAGLAMPAGTGALEVFSTHLYSGDDEEVYRSNLDELSEFIRQHHCAQSVVIITGDINIDALNWDEEITYSYLKEHMNDLRMEDLWLTHWGSKDQPGYGGARNPGGYTSSCPIDEDDTEQISQIKWVAGDEDFRGYCKEPGPTPQELTDRMCAINAVFCVTDPKKKMRGRRIDYIFLQRPDPCHAVNVDATRIRRRAFRRDSPKSRSPQSRMQFLTDHFGLDVTLIISRR